MQNYFIKYTYCSAKAMPLGSCPFLGAKAKLGPRRALVQTKYTRDKTPLFWGTFGYKVLLMENAR